jgi:hypothetical protein
LTLLEILRPNLFLVRNSQEQAALIDRDGKIVKLIPSPPFAGRPISHVEPLGQDRLIFFYIHPNEGRSHDIQAQVADHAGKILKPLQTIMRDGNGAAAFAWKWCSKNDLVVFFPVPAEDQGRFRYVILTE